MPFWLLNDNRTYDLSKASVSSTTFRKVGEIEVRKAHIPSSQMRRMVRHNIKQVVVILAISLFGVKSWSLGHVNSRPKVLGSTALLAEPRFGQPKTRRKYGADSRIGEKHLERIRTAGRVGTKKFVDPCKVFVGNLPFNVDEEAMVDFILEGMGQSRIVVHSAKVIYEWKTGKSKGYGFIIFSDPIYATVCIEECSGKMLDGRVISVSQGKKKDQDNVIYIKKKAAAPKTEEDAAILSALNEAESDGEDDDIPIFGDSESHFDSDTVLFGDDDNQEDDGIFLERLPKYEEMDPNLNRSQRREAAKRLKPKKMPHKGFG